MLTKELRNDGLKFVELKVARLLAFEACNKDNKHYIVLANLDDVAKPYFLISTRLHSNVFNNNLMSMQILDPEGFIGPNKRDVLSAIERYISNAVG